MVKLNLHLVMAAKGPMKMTDVAKATGLAPNTIAGLYHNKVKMIQLDTISKLCRALDCQVGDLLEYVPDPE